MIVWIGGGLLGWIGGGLVTSDGFVVKHFPDAAAYHYPAAVAGAVLVVLLGWIFARRARLRPRDVRRIRSEAARHHKAHVSRRSSSKTAEQLLCGSAVCFTALQTRLRGRVRRLLLRGTRNVCTGHGGLRCVKSVFAKQNAAGMPAA